LASIQLANDAIVIVLGEGHEVRVAPGFDSQTLERVLLHVLVGRRAGSAVEGASC
jgi:hypothetical protein